MGVRVVIKLSLMCAGIIALSLAVADTSNREGDKTMAKTPIPPIDASAPEKIETATFALG